MSVYFAEVGPYIKIGFSRDPERRVRNLFKGSTRYSAPRDCPLIGQRLIRHIDGTKETERAIHNALGDFRVGTEWFLNEPEVHEWIAGVDTAVEYEPLPRPSGPWEPPITELPPAAMAGLDRALREVSPNPLAPPPSSTA